MNIILDPHVHIYPNYDLNTFLTSLINNLKSAYPLREKDDHYAICLTERNECNFYEELKLLDTLKPFELNGFYKIEIDAIPLFIFPGAQNNSAEGVEVLALFYNKKLPTKMPLTDLINLINIDGGIPVINWAPGKWMGKRKKIISSMSLEKNLNFFLGYTKLLPKCFNYPSFIRKNLSNNHNIIFGSDPLPVSGEYDIAGSCGMILELKDEFSLEEIKQSFYKKEFKYFGERNSFVKVIYRLIKNEFKRRIS